MKKIKALFATPKKAALSSLCVLLLLAAAGTGSAYAASAIAENSSIGGENAKNFACADAGIDPAAIQVIRTEFDYEQGQFVYEVSFIANGIEYEYWVRAADGVIVKKEAEALTSDVPGAAAERITPEAAKESVLLDAGLSAEKVTFTKVELGSENGTVVYEIEFYAEGTEYDYKVYAATGAIYSKSKELLPVQQTVPPENHGASESGKPEQTTVPVTTAAGSGQSSAPAAKIGLDAAKRKALSDAGLSAAQVTYTGAKLDYDNGVYVYEIEFYTAEHKYDYEIHAVTGAVVSKDIEPRKAGSGSSSGNTGSTYIGVDKAKSIAIAHAGFSAPDVTFSKAKLENKDGRKVYEVEFYRNGIEYEYVVHASTGEIIEYESEYDA